MRACTAMKTNGKECTQRVFHLDLCRRHFQRFYGHEPSDICRTLDGGIVDHIDDWCEPSSGNSGRVYGPHLRMHMETNELCYVGQRCVNCERVFLFDHTGNPTDSDYEEMAFGHCPYKATETARLDIPQEVMDSLIRLVLTDMGWHEPMHICVGSAMCWSENKTNQVKTRIEEDKWLKTGKRTLTEIRKLLTRPTDLEALSTRLTGSETATTSPR